MSIFRRGTNKEYLNPDMCFAAWLVGGSIGKARKKLIDSGIKNPESNSDPSRMGIWFAATKSDMFTQFTEARAQSKNVSETPTKEEFDKAIVAYNVAVDEYHAKFG